MGKTQSHRAQDGLTGFGATRSAWDANHSADPNPKLIKRCCYLPSVDTIDQANADTYLLAASAPDVVSALTRNFAPHTTEQEALAQLRQQDFPSDAIEVKTKIGDGCKEFVFTSKLLHRNTPDLGPRFSFGLYPPDSDSNYSPNNVEQAIISADPELGAC